MTYGEITLLELSTLSLRFLWFALLATIDILAYPFSSTSFSFRRTLWRRFVRTMCPNSTIRQLQFVLPPVSVSYKQYATKRSLTADSEEIGQGARLHWFGRNQGEHTLLYFHGGGYVMPAIDSHYLLVDFLRKEVEARYAKSISVAFLEYTLANHAPWPQQGRQAVTALNYLLRRGVPPESIIIAGDSVGGHLVAFLLGHILNPHPAIQPIVPLKHPLAGAVMISPWVTFDEHAPSYKLNATTDLMPVSALRRWANLLKYSRQSAEEDESEPGYFEPEKAEPEWWAGLSHAVQHVLITAGGMEVMVDDAVSLGEKMRIGSKMDQEGIQIFVEKGVGHNEPIAGFATGDRPGLATTQILTWVGNLL